MGKSRFVTFALSLVPGLGHLYLGLTNRGLTLMGAFFGWIALIVIAAEVLGSRLVVLLVLLPVLWLYGLVDAFHGFGQLQAGAAVRDRSPLLDLGESLAGGERSRLWALVFSVVPGAGHMYLGWQQRGLELMTTFFLALFLMDWLHLSLFLFALPVIWFYSFFSALHLVSEAGISPDREKPLLSWLGQRQRWVGLGLIILGLLIIFERLVTPYLAYQVVDALRTGVIAALLIGGGLRLALGRKIASPAAETADEAEYAEETPANEQSEGGREGDKKCRTT